MASLDAGDKPTVKIACFPFNDPKSDLIIRSSDKVHFYVHKSLLSIVSPVFEGMFALPDDTSQETYDNRPCVPVNDDSSHLFCLLSWCDPRCKRPLPTLNNLAMALQMADKYDMTSVFAHARKDLSAYDIVDSECLRVFAIAIRFELDDVQQEAARATLNVALGRYNPPELKYIPASALQNLLRYHYRCKLAVRILLQSDKWLQIITFAAEHLTEGERHTHGAEYFKSIRLLLGDGEILWVPGGRTAPWWSKYLSSMVYILNERPSVLPPSEVEGIKRIISLDKCNQCSKYGYERLGQVSRLFASLVNEAISEVRKHYLSFWVMIQH